MKKTVAYLIGWLVVCLFTASARAQSEVDSGSYSVAASDLTKELTPGIEPLMLSSAVATSAGSSWVPRLPLIRSLMQFAYKWQDEGGRPALSSTSINTFTVPNMRLYFSGEAFRGLAYQMAVRFGADSSPRDMLLDGFLDWNVNEYISAVPNGFGIVMGKYPLSSSAAKGRTADNALQGYETPFAIGFPQLPAARILGVRPYIRGLFDGRVNAFYELSNGGAAAGSNVNVGNDFRHQVSFSFAPLEKFPLTPVEEVDLRNSPFGINTGFSYSRGWEPLARDSNPAPGTTTLDNTRSSGVNYYIGSLVAVWRGLYAEYTYTHRDQAYTPGPNKYDGGGNGHWINVSYAIPTPWGHIVPWYLYDSQNLNDRRVLRDGGSLTGGSVTGMSFTEIRNGRTSSLAIKEHWAGLNWYIAGEDVALKTSFRLDTIGKNTPSFQVTLQHRWYFNPGGKYR